MSKEKSNINWDLVAKHLAGETDGIEEAALLEWVNNSETNRRYLAELERWWQLTQYGKIDTEHHWLMLKQRLHINEPLPARLKRMMPPVRRRNMFRKYSPSKVYVAILAIMMVLGGMIHVFTGSPKRTSQPTEMAYNQFLVPAGQRSQIQLADGTSVWLNSGSRLQFPVNFNSERRMVKLEGEAYFEVVTDKKKPFVVQTLGLEVKVHGTSFNVTSYANEAKDEVALLSGSVKVAGLGGSNEIALQPGQKIVYTRSERLFTGPLNTDMATETAWRDGKLVFDDLSISEIAKKLERRYGVSIRIDSKNIEQLRFRGVFRNETLEQAMKAIQISAKFKYTIKDQEVIIY